MSRSSSGANVISEAAAAGLPVLASRIPGSVGLLGTDYPGFFTVGDTDALLRLLLRAENDGKFLAGLQRHMARIAPRFQPCRELNAWKSLLDELNIL